MEFQFIYLGGVNLFSNHILRLFYLNFVRIYQFLTEKEVTHSHRGIQSSSIPIYFISHTTFAGTHVFCLFAEADTLSFRGKVFLVGMG